MAAELLTVTVRFSISYFPTNMAGQLSGPPTPRGTRKFDTTMLTAEDSNLICEIKDCSFNRDRSMAELDILENIIGEVRKDPKNKDLVAYMCEKMNDEIARKKSLNLEFESLFKNLHKQSSDGKMSDELSASEGEYHEYFNIVRKRYTKVLKSAHKVVPPEGEGGCPTKFTAYVANMKKKPLRVDLNTETQEFNKFRDDFKGWLVVTDPEMKTPTMKQGRHLLLGCLDHNMKTELKTFKTDKSTTVDKLLDELGRIISRLHPPSSRHLAFFNTEPKHGESATETSNRLEGAWIKADMQNKNLTVESVSVMKAISVSQGGFKRFMTELETKPETWNDLKLASEAYDLRYGKVKEVITIDDEKKTPMKVVCYRCADSGHRVVECTVRLPVCSICGKKNHLTKAHGIKATQSFEKKLTGARSKDAPKKNLSSAKNKSNTYVNAREVNRASTPVDVMDEEISRRLDDGMTLLEERVRLQSSPHIGNRIYLSVSDSLSETETESVTSEKEPDNSTSEEDFTDDPDTDEESDTSSVWSLQAATLRNEISNYVLAESINPKMKWLRSGKRKMMVLKKSVEEAGEYLHDQFIKIRETVLAPKYEEWSETINPTIVDKDAKLTSVKVEEKHTVPVTGVCCEMRTPSPEVTSPKEVENLDELDDRENSDEVVRKSSMIALETLLDETSDINFREEITNVAEEAFTYIDSVLDHMIKMGKVNDEEIDILLQKEYKVMFERIMYDIDSEEDENMAIQTGLDKAKIAHSDSLKTCQEAKLRRISDSSRDPCQLYRPRW